MKSREELAGTAIACREFVKRTAHIGDPCIFCDMPHDDVEPGPCPAQIGPARTIDEAVAVMNRRAQQLNASLARMNDSITELERQHVLMQSLAIESIRREWRTIHTLTGGSK